MAAKKKTKKKAVRKKTASAKMADVEDFSEETTFMACSFCEVEVRIDGAAYPVMMCASCGVKLRVIK